MSLSAALRHRLAHQVVHAAVEIVDHVAALEQRLLGPGGVSRVDVAPERVLEPVGAVEDADAKPARHLVERIEEHRLALAVHVETLLDELIVVDDVLVQGPRVFGQPERGERPLLLGQVDGVNRRIAHRHRGMLGIDVDRGDIQPELGLRAQEQELAQAAHLHPGAIRK